MNIIKFNNTEFEVEGYNKNTYFNNDTMTSNASCSLKTSNATDINALAESPITSIQIRHDGELIYDLQNINAHLDNTNEYLAGDRMSINLNLSFDNAESSVV